MVIKAGIIAGFCLAAPAFFSMASAQEMWSGIIPDAFPGINYQWSLNEDGTYIETGQYRSSQQPAQTPLSGTWQLTNDVLSLTQDSYGYTFKGRVADDRILGTLYSYGQPISAFCAKKGDEAPFDCKTGDMIS
ncbi:MAG: copper resistance protein NlpE N-terminal domain-containing protein [Pseudomonadota bacterium]